MSVVIPHKFIDSISKARDPKRAILDFVGDLSGIRVKGDRVLIGIYMRPEKTKGGIIRPDANKVEDVWQGKVGLVLKWGPDAFKDPQTGQLYEDRVEVGQWGVFFIGDGRALDIKGAPCRLVRDVNFVLEVDDPDSIL